MRKRGRERKEANRKRRTPKTRERRKTVSRGRLYRPSTRQTPRSGERRGREIIRLFLFSLFRSAHRRQAPPTHDARLLVGRQPVEQHRPAEQKAEARRGRKEEKQKEQRKKKNKTKRTRHSASAAAPAAAFVGQAMLNRGHDDQIKIREFFDAVTGLVVFGDDRNKGYELSTISSLFYNISFSSNGAFSAPLNPAADCSGMALAGRSTTSGYGAAIAVC